MKWSSVIARKQFFEKYAKERGFNPLVARNWYRTDIMKVKVTPFSLSLSLSLSLPLPLSFSFSFSSLLFFLMLYIRELRAL